MTSDFRRSETYTNDENRKFSFYYNNSNKIKHGTLNKAMRFLNPKFWRLNDSKKGNRFIGDSLEQN